MQGALNVDKVVEHLDLKVGYACNNNCLFCAVAEKRKSGDKTREQIEKEISVSFSEGKKSIVFTGGECTIRKDIIHLVAFARSTGFKNIQIQTNGSMFACKDFANKMVISGMTEFAPALHGHNAEIHDGLTRRKGSWRQTVLGIKNIKALGVRTLTNTVITRQNYRNLPDIAFLLSNLRVDIFQMAFPHIMGNAYKYHKRIVPKISEVMPYVKKALDIGIKRGTKGRVEAIPFCFLQGYEKCVTEIYTSPVQVKEVGWSLDDFKKVRKEEAKKKFTKCLKCKFYNVCEGTWKEYPELFGEKEFMPVC